MIDHTPATETIRIASISLIIGFCIAAFLLIPVYLSSISSIRYTCYVLFIVDSKYSIPRRHVVFFRHVAEATEVGKVTPTEMGHGNGAWQ